MQSVAGACRKNACPRGDCRRRIVITLNPDCAVIDFNLRNSPPQAHLHGSTLCHAIKLLVESDSIDDDGLYTGGTILKLLAEGREETYRVKFIEDGIALYVEFTKGVGSDDTRAMHRLTCRSMFLASVRRFDDLPVNLVNRCAHLGNLGAK